MTAQWNREKLLEQSAAFQECRILLTAAELDLFSMLEDRPRTADDLAAARGWDVRALRILMDALAAMGILARSSSGYYGLPEHLAGLLSSTAAESILPMILHRGAMWQSWSNLTEVVRTGANPNPMGAGSRSQKEMEDFIGAMHVVGRDLAETIADSVDLSRYRRMLDIGGGSGTYIMAFLSRAPHMTATLLDRPDVVEMARKRLTHAGFISRVNPVAGDYNTDEMPEGHDLAFLSAVIHINNRQRNLDLFRRIHRSLDPGGTILIRDHFMDSRRTSPKSGAIFAVNMLVATQAGDSHTFADVKTDLETAGFENVRMIREGQDMDQLVAAVKRE
jgi:ubiquinone/menaquinone biosynthesis C-methylase UbiE